MKKKVNITFLIRSLHPGGAERQLVNLINGLDSDTFQISLITFYPDGDLRNHIIHPDIHIHSLNKRNRWDIVGFLLRYFRLLSSIKPDILHGYLSMSNIIAAISKIIHPKMVVIFGIRSSYHDLSKFDWLAKLEFFTEARFARLADRIIVNSESGKNNLIRKKYPSQKINVIPNGINTDAFSINREAGKAFREYWDIPSNIILIGIVGRLDPVKNHPLFINAASEIIKKIPNTQFICVGSGNDLYEQHLKEMSDNLLSNKLKWIPTQTDMLSVYNALDICCNVSINEGFSNVIGEAMACGIPCIVTDVGDSGIIVGDTGIVIESNNQKALENAIITLINSKSRKESEFKTRERIINNFSQKELTNRTERLLLNFVVDK